MKSFHINDLKVPVPIVQGGMGVGISLSGLASAVANMGGIGIISSVAIGLTNTTGSNNYKKNNIQTLRDEIRKARSMSSGVLGVNIMTVITNFQDMVKTSIEEGIDIIFSGAGLPLDLPKYLNKGDKTKLVPIVSSGRAASIISEKWLNNYNYLPDAFVIEGPKAGGHLGFKNNMIENKNNDLDHLVDDVLEVSKNLEQKHNRKVPIIAAGGIYSGADIHHYLNKGVSAAQLGTRFVATEECDASEVFKEAFVQAKEQDVEIIKSPVGMPGRTIFNQFLKDAMNGDRRPAICRHHCIKTCNPKTTLFCIADALISAYNGNLATGFAFTGSSVGQVTKISKVQQVFEDIKQEYQQAKKSFLK
ncbi:MAG: nitronate monooxygenase [Bacteroidales bacterium]|nr:nitronate monooxygenase [Bacteroidales bacterium]MCF8327725.1 nitronate monooxygenase [Bacteroidales bacterium]